MRQRGRQGTKLSIAFDYASGNQALDQADAAVQVRRRQGRHRAQHEAEAVQLGDRRGGALHADQATCGWQIANWGGGWIYAPDYLPTGESLFATGSVANSGNYSDPKMDQLIKASQQQNGTGPLYKYQDYAAEQLPVIYQPNAYTDPGDVDQRGRGRLEPDADPHARVLVPHPVTRFLLRRTGQAVVVLLLVTLIVFVLLHLLPGGAARATLGTRATPSRSPTSTTRTGWTTPSGSSTSSGSGTCSRATSATATGSTRASPR